MLIELLVVFKYSGVTVRLVGRYIFNGGSVVGGGADRGRGGYYLLQHATTIVGRLTPRRDLVATKTVHRHRVI